MLARSFFAGAARGALERGSMRRIADVLARAAGTAVECTDAEVTIMQARPRRSRPLCAAARLHDDIVRDLIHRAEADGRRLLALAVLTGAAVACDAPMREETTTVDGPGSADGGVETSGDATAGDAPGQPPSSVLFSPETKRVVLEVDYAPGAAPFTGATGRLGSIWEIFAENANAIFDGRKEVEYPSTLEEMEALGDVVETRFTTRDILAIAERHRTRPSGSGTVTFYAVFLSGHYVDGEGVEHADTLGVAISGTGVIGMFKPVIAATASKGATTPRFVEQATLVHELGHAIGLVDAGIPLASAHLDPAHPHHCSSAACAMYWANEGSKDAVAFVQAYLETGNRVIVGRECLDDIRAYEARPE